MGTDQILIHSAPFPSLAFYFTTIALYCKHWPYCVFVIIGFSNCCCCCCYYCYHAHYGLTDFIVCHKIFIRLIILFVLFFFLTSAHIFSITRFNWHIPSLYQIDEIFCSNCVALRYALISISGVYCACYSLLALFLVVLSTCFMCNSKKFPFVFKAYMRGCFFFFSENGTLAFFNGERNRKKMT